MGRETTSLRSKAVHFVSDLTTVLLNPISDEPSSIHHHHHHHHHDDKMENRSDQESNLVEDSEATDDGPDTSSFTAFLYSLLSPESGNQYSMEEQYRNRAELGESVMDSGIKETSGTKNIISRSKKSLGRALNQAVRFSGFRNQSSENKVDCDMKNYNGNDSKLVGLELRPVQTPIETVSQFNLPEISEPSLLLSEKTRSSLYNSLPVLAQGRKWVLLYSTWRHGISLSTLYRRSMICPGFSLLVVGDRKGAVFGGLVEAPLRPTNKRKYQGTNNSFVFTNTSGHPAVFRPTGANRYFTLCSSEFLALGGGGHFALYLDGDLLNGSSSVSETFGNPCLARSEDFEVKELELWGFAYASKYEEIIAFSQTEAPGICRW